MDWDAFRTRAEDVSGLALSDEQVQQFETYLAILLAWNAHTNLTGIREPAEIVDKHFLDSLSCLQVMPGLAAGQTLIDVGTGAGFPGLPLKIARPELEVTLVDSVGKKCRFLEEVIGALGLSGAAVIADRAEEMGHQRGHRQHYDWATARALGRMPILLEYLLPLVKIGGTLVAQKGESAIEETTEAANAIRLLGGRLREVRLARLGDVAQAHHLVVIDKIAATPITYPRRAGLPVKKPL